MKKIDFKKLLFYIFITFLIGASPSIFTYKSMDIYNTLNKPAFSPPSIVFPIVWAILYILMGISFYRIKEKGAENKSEAVLIYFIQLIVNALWTPIFFLLNQYFLAFLWILMLIILTIVMIIVFYKNDKLAAYLQIPYLLWLLYAAYLNFSIFVLN